MSEIFVDTIKNKAGSTSLDSDKLPDMYNGSAKAHANFNGTTATIRDSFNITSITDNGTGDYTFTITNSLENEDYSVSACSQYYKGGNTGAAYLMGMEIKHTTTAMAAGNVSFWHRYSESTTFYDCTTGCFSIHGDLA